VRFRDSIEYESQAQTKCGGHSRFYTNEGCIHIQIVVFVSLDMTFIFHIGIYMSHKYTFLDKET
jgi:hypothetical protein